MVMSSVSARTRVDLKRTRNELPDLSAELVSDYERHLRWERGLSEHTVRAYIGDVVSLLGHLHGVSGGELADLDVGLLRSWLAHQRSSGSSRTTLSRRRGGGAGADTPAPAR